MLDDSGIIMAVNPGWEKADSPLASLVGKTGVGSNYFTACDKVAGSGDGWALGALEGLRAVSRGERAEFAVEGCHEGPGGSRWVEMRVGRLLGGGGVAFWVACRDITDHKRAEAARNDSEKRYRELFDQMNNGVAVYRALDDGRDFVIVDFNRAAERMDRDSRGHLVGKRLTEVRPGVENFGLLDALRRVWKTGSTERLPVVRYHDHRLQGWYENYLYRLPSGEVVAVFDNVTEHRQREAALLESEQRFSKVFRSCPVAIGLSRLSDNRFLDVNDAFVRLYGYTREEIVGRTAEELRLWHTGDRDSVIRRAREQGQRQTVEMQARRKDGGIRELLATIDLIELGGEPCLLGILTDITERKRAEEAFREGLVLRHQAAENAPDAVVAIDREYRLLFNNKRHRRVLAATGVRALRVGENVLSPAESPEERGTWRSAYDRALRGEVFHFETRSKDAEGRAFVLEHNLSPLRDANGTIVGALVVAHDVTERKQVEETLRSSREQLRTLAGRLQSVREEERTVVAREIHDVLAQELTRLKMDIAWLQRRMGRPLPPEQQPAIVERLELMSAVADTAIVSVQRIATGLRPVVLDTLGLAAAVEWAGREFQDRTGVLCRTSVTEEEMPVDKERATAAFRILQESLTNIARHAGATEVEIRLG